jgi:hypothetical protein
MNIANDSTAAKPFYWAKNANGAASTIVLNEYGYSIDELRVDKCRFISTNSLGTVGSRAYPTNSPMCDEKGKLPNNTTTKRCES